MVDWIVVTLHGNQQSVIRKQEVMRIVGSIPDFKRIADNRYRIAEGGKR
jgi:hypothetical protein